MKLDKIESLMKLMQEYGVNELSLDTGDGASIELAIGSSIGVPMAMAPAPTAHVVTAAAPAAESADPAVPSNFSEVQSPMVGTFYSAPKPGTPNFVKVGDRVAVGQTLCIVEAMKLMNEIESEVAGTVREILVENAGPVQFGQVLFRIEAD